MSTKKLNNVKKAQGKNLQIRQRIVYSEDFKREKVKALVEKQIKVSELSALYNISKTAIYKWLYRYSPHHNQGTTQVIQMESEAAKVKKLQSKIVELEAALGRKQLQIDYYDKLLEKGSEELGYDLKKNFAAKVSNGSESTGNNTTTV